MLTLRNFGSTFGDDPLEMLFLRGFDVLDALGLVIWLAMVSITDQTLVADGDGTSVAEVLWGKG